MIISSYDLVIDATDNFEARYIINDACVLSGVPFISGSSVGLEGQVRVVVPYLRYLVLSFNLKKFAVIVLSLVLFTPTYS